MPYFSRILTPLLVLPLLASPALAWTPALDEATAQKVIDSAMQRPVDGEKPTFLSVNLAVEGGTFKTPDAVIQFAGPETCTAQWLAQAPEAGSRIQSVTVSGQADSVYWQAAKAYTEWRNLKATDVLTPEARAGRMADGQLRADVKLSGVPSEATRRAYRVRLQVGEGQFLEPARRSYVADWKQGTDGLWSGTAVYYFSNTPPEGQSTPRFDPNSTVALQFLNEKGECGYSIPLNLAAFY